MLAAASSVEAGAAAVGIRTSYDCAPDHMHYAPYLTSSAMRKHPSELAVTNDSADPAADGSSAAHKLAREIRRLRIDADLSQARLDAMIGYSPQYISLAERPSKGSRPPPSSRHAGATGPGIAFVAAGVGVARRVFCAHDRSVTEPIPISVCTV